MTLPVTLCASGAMGRPAFAAAAKRSLMFDLGPLTKQQRLDDFDYVCNIIEEKYAPLQLKEKLWDFEWEALKSTYRERIAHGHMSHGEFGTTMRAFVAELHDAHTHLIHYRESIMNGLSARASTLGFLVERRIRQGQSDYVISAVVPNFFVGKHPPVKKGDVLVAIDDRAPQDIIREDLAPLGTTGREDSDLTVLSRDLTVRVSPLYVQRPSGTARVTVRSGDQARQLTLAWVDTNMQDLRRALHATQASPTQNDLTRDPLHAFITGRDAQGRYLLSVDREGSVMRLLRGEQGFPAVFQNQYVAQSQVLLSQSFKSADEKKSGAPESATALEVSGLPFHVFTTARGLAASYRVEDFMFSRMRCEQSDPNALFILCSDLTGEDYAQAFAALARSFGVRDLVLDLRNNGGGALAFSNELLRAFSPDGAQGQSSSVRVNEDWLGIFSYMANDSHSPISLRAAYEQQARILKQDVQDGARMSHPLYIQGEAILPGNMEARELPRLHVLINESCASACDIFAASVQDAKLGTILGRRSIGAGGNVVHGGESPHERFRITQTASLMYRADGSFVENAGVTPDVLLDDSEDDAVWRGVIAHIEK